jgi:hypothetical protein
VWPVGHRGRWRRNEISRGCDCQRYFGKELRLPSRGARGGYFLDWALARLDASGALAEFVAVEVQSIDTTGICRPEVELLRVGHAKVPASKAGLNWENVSKRILPQLICNGHILRREPLCRKGLFFFPPPATSRQYATSVRNGRGHHYRVIP